MTSVLTVSPYDVRQTARTHITGGTPVRAIPHSEKLKTNIKTYLT